MNKKLLGFALLLGMTGLADAAQIQDARVNTEKNAVNLVLELDQRAEYKSFSLSAPDRLVIDIADTPQAAVLDKLSFPADGPILKLRQGVQNEKNLRLVLELSPAAQSRIDVSRDKHGQRISIAIAADSKLGATAKPVVEKKPDLETVSRSKAERPAPPGKVAKGGGRDVVVVIDPGHGGHDSGAVGPNGVREKDVVLEISRKLADELNRQPGIRAVLTRSDDLFIPLRQRIQISRGSKADMFVSVHADAFTDQRARGSSVFVLSERGASSEMARWLAASENAFELRNGASLDNKDAALKSVLLDLSQAATIAESMDAAGRVLGRLERIGNIHRGFVEQAGFVVLKSLDIPSMLIETAFISNPAEEQRLNDATFQQRLATTIAEGVRDYLVAKPIPGTRLAALSAARGRTADSLRSASNEHIISAGESLSVIAQKYQITMDQLRSLNGITDDNLIKVGQILKLPQDG